MQSILKTVSNPIWVNAEQTAINCEITTSQFGDEILPFTASLSDVELHGQLIFADIVSGKYGPIADYVAPLIPENNQPIVNGAQTL
jgi:hypothetical protein